MGNRVSGYPFFWFKMAGAPPDNLLIELKSRILFSFYKCPIYS